MLNQLRKIQTLVPEPYVSARPFTQPEPSMGRPCAIVRHPFFNTLNQPNLELMAIMLPEFYICFYAFIRGDEQKAHKYIKSWWCDYAAFEEWVDLQCSVSDLLPELGCDCHDHYGGAPCKACITTRTMYEHAIGLLYAMACSFVYSGTVAEILTATQNVKVELIDSEHVAVTIWGGRSPVESIRLGYNAASAPIVTLDSMSMVADNPVLFNQGQPNVVKDAYGHY